MAESLKRTLLYPWHAEHGARFAEFAGWDMPIQYSLGALGEHRLVRKAAGLFDIAHMGRFLVRGTKAGPLLDHLLTAPLGSLPVGESRYALLCNEDGGVLDDVFVYRFDGTSAVTQAQWMVVVNAANLARDLEWMVDHARSFNVSIDDVSDTLYMIALQGPQAIPIADAVSGSRIGPVPRFGIFEGDVAGVPCIAGRTGYTGEDGVELYFSAEKVKAVWEAILTAGQKNAIDVGAIGLAARDSLRFEPGFALYGHELDPATNPLEAGLKWACDLSKEFIGRDAIVEAASRGLSKRLVTVKLVEKGVPRPGCAVYHDSGSDPIGNVVSGMYAPTLNGYFANVFIRPDAAASGTELAVEIRGQKKAAVVVKRPIYRPAYR